MKTLKKIILVFVLFFIYAYVVSIDNLLCLEPHSNLKFIPFNPKIESSNYLIYKKLKALNKSSLMFLDYLRKEIENFNKTTEYNKNLGTVVEVGDGIAIIYGLQDVILGELLEFQGGVYGMVMNLEEDSLSAVLLGEANKVKEGDTVKGTGKVATVPVGDELLGRVVDALGRPIDDRGEIKTSLRYPIERKAPPIIARESVNSPIETGIKCIDALIPIGKGQRELIIGDRQSGKTAIAVDTIINQKGKNVICIYVAIGQKNSSVATIYDKLNSFGAMDYTLIVNASASELSPLLYIAPFAGMSMAEYWMEKGKDVLIIFDDLSKHAIAYRALSLLLKRSPGREAYPGDIFYLHSRLLERAAKLNKKLGGGSITALPIIETLAGDISAYIPTNVISITDGQIFLSTDLFNAGQRPAVDVGLSVSRVGSNAQYRVMKQVSSSMKMEIASYKELANFAQFGSDLDKKTKETIKHGEVLTEVLKQDQYSPYILEKEVLEIFAVKNKFLDDLDVASVNSFLENLWTYMNNFHKKVLDEIKVKKELSQELEKKLYEAISEFKKEQEFKKK